MLITFCTLWLLSLIALSDYSVWLLSLSAAQLDKRWALSASWSLFSKFIKKSNCLNPTLLDLSIDCVNLWSDDACRYDSLDTAQISSSSELLWTIIFDSSFASLNAESKNLKNERKIRRSESIIFPYHLDVEPYVNLIEASSFSKMTTKIEHVKLSSESLSRSFDHEKWRSSKLWNYHSWRSLRKSSLCRLSILMSICSICINKCDFDYISYEKGNSNAMSRSSFNSQILEISSSIIQGHSTCERWPLRWLRKLRAKRFSPSKDHSR